MTDSLSSFDLVLFGGTGDLATRKLIPALYRRERADGLPDGGRVIACGRTSLSRDAYVQIVCEALHRRLKPDEWDHTVWARFVERIEYLQVDPTDRSGYGALEAMLRSDPGVQRVFFLAISPDLFVTICDNLAANGLVTATSRVVLEKPLGHDRASAIDISDRIGRIFPEAQTFRIDHYLGKETVQNLLALRFGNALFEPLWRREWVRDVQITCSETIGAEGRGEFYDRTGALRDMIQSHLLQLLCITAMEPLPSLEPEAVRAEKLKVLRSLRPLEGREAIQNTVRGQYTPGVVLGRQVGGYPEAEGVSPDSRTETFVALRVHVDNWRWAGVPFYLRTGKRMQRKVAEIVVNFHEAPQALFGNPLGAGYPNRLIIRLQPDEGLHLTLWGKAPGDRLALRRMSLDLDFEEAYQRRSLDAYERLLCDVLRGRLTLFMSRPELETAWAWIDPIRRTWEDIDDRPRRYASGTWGPPAASGLLARDGAAWHEEW
ncbi:MAG TPA: glucose-6-phosphate dehydrogenase [Gammaproteobacteria bacterium]|nr:glucose-6-phosphate dehydrogenase [Gammaproteobacteria bacterium]